MQSILSERFLKEKAIANATIVAGVGSTNEKWCNL
jgi:hypothetical protein